MEKIAGICQTDMECRSKKHMTAARMHMSTGKHARAVQHVQRSMDLEFGGWWGSIMGLWGQGSNTPTETASLISGRGLHQGPRIEGSADMVKSLSKAINEVYLVSAKHIQGIQFLLRVNEALGDVGIEDLMHDLMMKKAEVPPQGQMREDIGLDLLELAAVQFGGVRAFFDGIEAKISEIFPDQNYSAQQQPYIAEIVSSYFKKWIESSTKYFQVLHNVSDGIRLACEHMTNFEKTLDKRQRSYLYMHNNQAVKDETNKLHDEMYEDFIAKLSGLDAKPPGLDVDQCIVMMKEVKIFLDSCVGLVIIPCEEYHTRFEVRLDFYWDVMRHLISVDARVYRKHLHTLLPAGKRTKQNAGISVFNEHLVLMTQGVVSTVDTMMNVGKCTKDLAEVVLSTPGINDDHNKEIAVVINEIEEQLIQFRTFQTWNMQHKACQQQVQLAITKDDVGKMIIVHNQKLYITNATVAAMKSIPSHDQICTINNQRVVRWPHLLEGEGPRDYTGVITKIGGKARMPLMQLQRIVNKAISKTRADRKWEHIPSYTDWPNAYSVLQKLRGEEASLAPAGGEESGENGR